jgi:hypothetical protein
MPGTRVFAAVTVPFAHANNFSENAWPSRARRENFTQTPFGPCFRSTVCWKYRENTVGIHRAKEDAEFRLTEKIVRVKFANCPRNKSKTTTT